VAQQQIAPVQPPLRSGIAGIGRPPGALNKINKPKELFEIIKSAVFKNYPSIEDYDPVVELAIIANDKTQAVELRASCHARIIPYVYPTLKSVEISGKVTLEERHEVIDQLLEVMVTDDGDNNGST